MQIRLELSNKNTPIDSVKNIELNDTAAKPKETKAEKRCRRIGGRRSGDSYSRSNSRRSLSNLSRNSQHSKTKRSNESDSDSSDKNEPKHALVERRSDGKLSVISLSALSSSDHEANLISIGNKKHCEKEFSNRVQEKYKILKENSKDSSNKMMRANNNIKEIANEIAKDSDLLAEVVKLLTARIVEMQQSLDSERGKNSLLETEVEWLLSEAKKYSFMRMCFNYIESFTEKPNQDTFSNVSFRNVSETKTQGKSPTKSREPSNSPSKAPAKNSREPSASPSRSSASNSMATITTATVTAKPPKVPRLQSKISR